MNRIHILKTLPFFLLVLTFIACDQQDQIVVEPGISWDLAKQRKSEISYLEYDLQLDIPKELDSAILGKLIIGLKIKKREQPVILDFNVQNNDAVRSVRVNGKTAQYQHRDEHVIISEKYFKKDFNEIAIEFQAGELALNRSKDFLYTLFVPDRASTAFPCFDQPDLKAKYKLSLKIPQEWNALSYAKVQNEENIDGKRAIDFGQSDLMSTYLFSFVAGKFEQSTYDYNGREMTMLYRESDTALVNRNLEEIFELHGKSLDWLEEYTGIDFPFQKLDFAAIPGFQYGGMEHVGAIQYRSSLLFLDEAATLNAKMRRAGLIAHEVAHMWFGNYVTMEWFNDVWLKEVFANFMADKITNPMFPDVNHDLKFLFSHYPQAYSVDRTEGANSIRQDLTNLKNAGTLYGNIIYHKAPIIMRQLESIVGENVFRSSLQDYLTNNAMDNARWDDLIKEIDYRTEVDLKEWSDVWVDQPGYPMVDLELVSTPEVSQYEIVQYDLSGEGKIWPQQFTVTFSYQEGDTDFPIFIDQEHYEIKKSKTNAPPNYFHLNSRGLGYGVFKQGLDYVKSEFLFNKARVDIPSITDETKRGAAYLNLHEFLMLEGVNPAMYLVFLDTYLRAENNELIVKFLLDKINLVFWRFMTPKMRSESAHMIERTLLEKIDAVESQAMKSLIFSRYIELVITDYGIQNLYDFWQNENLPQGIVVTENLRVKLASHLALKDGNNGMEAFDQQMDSIANMDKRAKLEFIKPALSHDQKTRDMFFESLKLAENRAVETWVLEALEYLHHPHRDEASIQYLKPSLELLPEIQLTGDIFFPKRWLDQVLYGYNSREAVNIVNAYLEENPNLNPNLRNKLLQSADMLFRAERELVAYMAMELNN